MHDSRTHLELPLARNRTGQEAAGEPREGIFENRNGLAVDAGCSQRRGGARYRRRDEASRDQAHSAKPQEG